MSFLNPYRRRPEVRTLPGLKCASCGGGLYLSRA